MPFDPRLAEVRFGTGPGRAAPRDVPQMLARLAGPDLMARRFEIPPFADVLPEVRKYREAVKFRKSLGDTPQAKAAQEAVRELRRAARRDQQFYLTAALCRAAVTEDGFRERLTRFWADHFTAKGKRNVLRYAASPYVEEAIRPHLTGTFAELLKAAVTSPLMLMYLDQPASTGPNSIGGKKKNRGLNENLAREVMELHTLGVGGPYTQTDVRQLAELFTGLSVDSEKGMVFRRAMAEPGAETVLGESYGGGQPRVTDVYAVLDDLARHPATARHIARKLVVHFVSDTPDEALVAHVAAAFEGSGGDLPTTYAALLEHPAAWAPALQKARQPFDYVAASLRVLDVPPATLQHLKWRDIQKLFYLPMRVMGQTWENPIGPDGWPEEAEAWITPQGMAGRIQWAMRTPSRLLDDLPDPREFVQLALGDSAPKEVVFAASAAENRAVGVGLVLVAPEFQRR